MAVMTEREREIQRQATANSPSPVIKPGRTFENAPAKVAVEPVNLTVIPHPLRPPGGLREAATHGEYHPMGQRGPRPVRMARELSWRSPMLFATLIASFVVSLLCFYVTAYARVNAERLELAQLHQDLKVAERQELSLKAEISDNTLSAPQRALAMGLMPTPSDAVQVLTVGDTTSPANSTPATQAVPAAQTTSVAHKTIVQ